MIRQCLWILLVVAMLAGALDAQEAASLLRNLGYDPGQYTRMEISVNQLPNLGLVITRVKGTNPSTGESVGGAVDQHGRKVEFSALLKQEVAARLANPVAKLHVRLDRALATAQGERLPVIAWLRFDSEAYDEYRSTLFAGIDLKTSSPEAVRVVEDDMTRWVLGRNAEVTAPFVEALRTLGINPRYVSTTAPTVAFAADGQQILALARLATVDTIYLETADKQDSNEDSNATHRTDRVHSRGVKGRDIKVAVLENNGIDPSHPWLNCAAWFNSGTPNPDDHVQGTSGCIASQHPNRLGAAPDVELHSANAASYGDTDVEAAGDWIIPQNVDITNLSWGPLSPTGVPDFSDRYFDYQSRTFGDSYVAAGSNAGIGSFVGNVGWNIIAVGAITNGGNSDYTDDAMACYSSTANPTTGCEKPNVVAVGSGVDTLGDGTVSTFGVGCSPTSTTQTVAWLVDQYNGTSFSSPHTVGNMANAFAVNSTLIGYPEAAMAMIMATAWHNIEGSSRLSGQDGAGCINGLAAFNCANAGRIHGAGVNSASFSNNSRFVHNVFLQGGDKARVCIAWSSKANAAYTTDVLDADLDLYIYAGQNQGSGTSLGSSTSFNNNFEIVEFTPATTGWYSLAVNDFTFNGTQEFLGFAWTQKGTDTRSARLREWTSSDIGPQITGGNYYMDFEAPNSPGAIYMCAPGTLVGGGLQFSSETWIPLTPDIWTTVWLDDLTTNIWFWDSSIGTLDSTGHAYSNRMHVPNSFSFLKGMRLTHIGLTIETGYPDNFKEITEPHTFDFWPDGVDHTLSDDGFINQTIPFTFKFFGVNYTDCYVNSNGSITFGSGDTDFTPSASEMLSDQPRIAFFWDDLGPHQVPPSGSLDTRIREVTINNESLVVEFINVPHRTSSISGTTGDGSNTVRVILSSDGTISMDFKDCTEATCLVGISPGNGVSTATELDLSSSGEDTSGTNQALFEYFSSSSSDAMDLNNPNIWWNKLRFVPTNSSNNNYRLKMDIDQ